MRHRSSEKGFTLIEMLVVAPVVILAIGAFLAVIISMTGEVLASRASNNLSYNVQDALDHIEQDIKMSNSYLATNNVLGTAQGYNNDATAFTNVAGASGTSLILNVVATTTNPVSTSSSYVYLKNKPDPCSTPQNNTPFTYNVVYFIKNDTLYRRTLMPANYTDVTNTVCAVPWQQPSCLPTYMDAQAGSVFCKTKDIELVRGVTPADFSIQYFNGEAATAVNSPASSTSIPVGERASALQSATTVGVTIRAEQMAAGRTIERVAVLRASRLDANASAIAVITTDGAPSAPKVSSTITNSTDVVFSWPTVTTASGYTFQYKVNGGGWVTGFTNQPTRTFTVSSATHQDVVLAQVTAINTAGSSGYGTASATVPLWAPLDLTNGWVDYSPPYSSAAYTKTSAGVIVLKGMVRSGAGNIATLPPGYRPGLRIMFENSSAGNASRVDIDAAGIITLQVGSNGWFSLDGIAFMPAGTTFNAATLVGGWVNYDGAGGWEDAGYALDGAGRVQLTGLIKSGNVGSGSAMFTLPSGYRPSEYLHMLNDIDNIGGHYSVDSAGQVLAKGYSNGYSSLQSTYYPTGRATGASCTTQWCALPFVNGWKHYGSPYATPQYTKGSDGIVMLKGLINGGSSAGAQISIIPAGYCPRETLLLATASSATWARIDITRNANGTCNLIPGAGASTNWISLDNIHYIAEP